VQVPASDKRASLLYNGNNYNHENVLTAGLWYTCHKTFFIIGNMVK